MVAMDASMQLNNVIAASGLMQPIDVLRYNRLAYPLRLQLRKFAMASIGFRIEREHAVAIKIVELLGMSFKKAMAYHFFRRIRIFLRKEAI